jgi:hypothetical protein
MAHELSTVEPELIHQRLDFNFQFVVHQPQDQLNNLRIIRERLKLALSLTSVINLNIYRNKIVHHLIIIILMSQQLCSLSKQLKNF